MALDPEIRALVAASERGEVVPQITVMAGGMWIIGQPAGAAAFARAVRQAKVDEYAATLIPSSGWKGMQKVNKEEARLEAERMADDFVGLLGDSSTEVDSLTLLDARVIPSQGNGVHMPAVRIPAAAIAAWWVGLGQLLKASQAGFVAVSFPLPS